MKKRFTQLTGHLGVDFQNPRRTGYSVAVYPTKSIVSVVGMSSDLPDEERASRELLSIITGKPLEDPKNDPKLYAIVSVVVGEQSIFGIVHIETLQRILDTN